MKWLAWSELALVVILGTVGQLVLKYALRHHASAGFTWRLAFSRPMVAWLLSYGVTTVLWVLALRSVPLSQAFPILGLQFALVPLASSHLLQERVGGGQWVGVIAIVAGVALVSQS